MANSPLDSMARDLREQARACARNDRERSNALLSAAAKADRLARALAECDADLGTYLSPAMSRKELLDARWQAAIEASWRAYMPADAQKLTGYRNRLPAKHRGPTFKQQARDEAEKALIVTLELPEFADIAGELDTIDEGKGADDGIPW